MSKRILIVEDELLAAEYLRSFLLLHGYDVVEICDTGEEAVEAARRHKPEIIFMDIMLRGALSGAEAALRIRAFSDTEFIFLTAYNDPEMLDYALAAGAVYYLIKPYNDKQILTTLKMLQKRCPNHRRPSETETSVLKLCEGYTYDIRTRQLMRHGERIYLGEKSAKAIDLLCRRPHDTSSPLCLSQHVYGEEKPSSTIRALIHRINKRLGVPLIRNINGYGYKIALHRHLPSTPSQ